MSARTLVTPLLVSLVTLSAACAETAPETSGSAGGGGSTTTSSTTSFTPSPTTSSGGQGGSGGSGDGGWGGSTWNDPDLAANAGYDQSVSRNQFVLLQGAYSWAGSDSGFASNWLQISGEPVTLQDPSALVTGFTAPSVLGPLVFRLRVKDDYGHGKSDEVTIHVIDAPPVADAGPDQGAPGGAQATLHGYATDSDDPVAMFEYTWTQVSGPAVPLDVTFPTLPTLTVPADLTEPLVYALTVSDGFTTSAPDWVTVRRVEEADTDGDLLGDMTESQLGTDPTSADTDGDGVPDGWEVLGHESVDYPGLGCDPLHKDLLVALRTQQYTDANGAFHSAHPTPLVTTALAQAYAGLAIDNPDGLPGIALHLVDDAPLPEDFVCVYAIGIPSWGEDAAPDFLYREAFHHVRLCLGSDLTGQWGGIAEIGGRTFAMEYPEMNDDPSDDLDEEAAFRLYEVFLHEMGHNLSLRHGGDQDLNYKPVYPSVMNYHYANDLDGSSPSIAKTTVLFSDGSFPSVNECAVVEKGIFQGLSAEDAATLTLYPDGGWTVAPDGSVDWDHDGTLADTPYELVLRPGTGLGDPTTCQVLHDSDDLAMISVGIAKSLPSDPGADAPAALRFKLGDRPPSAP
ncbi:MAG: hypothetical protein U0441_10595 [Polyangiaceae bacterium]